eukprot:GILI01008500.1.p1 GENE.GILI01008500.1~~GILI01008500.1.p1  ORF type:complete len:509 (-),score=63.65 GILI01008500.1:155-1681(-)
MRYLVLTILVTLLAAAASAQTTVICLNAQLSDGLLSPSTGVNTITYCSIGNVVVQPQNVGLMSIRASQVLENSLLSLKLDSTIAYTFNLDSMIFLRDARVAVEGPLVSGTSLIISNCSFDVRAPKGGDTIAIDLRGMLAIAQLTTFRISNCFIHIEGNTAVAAPGLLAAIAGHATATFSEVSFRGSYITINNTNTTAYGFHYVISTPVFETVTIFANDITRVGDQPGADLAIAFFVRVPMSNGSNQTITSSRALTLSLNTIDRIGVFADVAGMFATVSVLYNTHSHYAQLIANFTLGQLINGPSVSFSQNTFITFFESWNPLSFLANTLIQMSIPKVTSFATFANNDFQSSKVISTPFSFPGSTNLELNTTLRFYGNFFTTNSLDDRSVSMVSFASDLQRTEDLGTVSLCSNTWPSLFVSPTTTTPYTETTWTGQTTNPPTRTRVASSESIDLFIDNVNRPVNITFSEDCPVSFSTRPPRTNNYSPGTHRGLKYFTTFSILLVLAFTM